VALFQTLPLVFVCAGFWVSSLTHYARATQVHLAARPRNSQEMRKAPRECRNPGGIFLDHFASYRYTESTRQIPMPLS